MAEQMKRIKILTSGPIPSRGNIYGPVLTPFYETLSSIFKFVASGIEVVEVLSDGSEVKLTVSNYKADNEINKKIDNGSDETKNPEETVTQDETVVETTEDETKDQNENVAETVDETVVETIEDETKDQNENVAETVDETTEDETAVETTEEHTNPDVKRNKKNKHNRH